MAALVIQRLCKTYASGLVALDNVNLVVEPGDFFALLGRNGAGKTTLIGILTSLVNKTSGQVLIEGHDIDKDWETAKSLIGVVPQEFNLNLFERVLDILINQAGFYGLPAQLAHARAEQYLTALGLWEKRHTLVRTLSGGMKRRLMVARALVHQPRLLILDEPTAGVDIELRRSLWTFLTQLNAQGTTIILTTHYLEEAETLCRKIAILEQGQLIENTAMKALFARLHTETFVLDLKQPLMNNNLSLPGCTLVTLDEKTAELVVDKSVTLNQIFAALSAQGIQVESLRNKTNRLEELFVQRLQEEQIA